MYNPLPLGKSAQSGTPRGTPQWQPLKPLRPIELQNAGFVQENYASSKPNKFALWTVEEQQADNKLAESALSDDADVIDVDAKGDANADTADSSASGTRPLSALDAEALEKIKQEAYERGVADGKELQRTADEAKSEKEEAESLEALAEKANQILSNIEQSVQALQENPAAWNEPLKRLALHLAEQLTLTELSISSSGIQNLIDRCIETLDVQTASSVVVELNPNDMALLQNHKAVPGEQTHTWRMVADAHLLPGSVRVRADDAVVSDLIEHRLETLAHALLEDPKPWQAQTAFQPERLAARRGKAETVEDALPRDAAARFKQDPVAPAADDIVDAEPPLDLAAMELPDLDLPNLDLGNDAPAKDDSAEEPSHD